MQARLPDVALFAMHLELGGAERMLVTVANALADRGHQVDLVLASKRGFHLSEVSKQVNLVPLGVDRLRHALFPLRRYLRARHPPVVYSTLTTSNVVLGSALLGLPVRTRVVLQESSVPSRARHAYGTSVRIAYALAPFIYRRADAVVAVSSGVADEVGRLLGVDRGRVHVVYNPNRPPLAAIPFEAPHPWLKGGRSHAKTESPPRRHPVVLSIGRLTAAKGIDQLLRALAHNPDLQCVRALVLGDGPARQSLEAMSANLDLLPRVQFVGRVEEPREWLAFADLLAMTSTFESFSAVLVEALEMGTPVVSFDCPHGPREILAGGLYGTLVDSACPADLGPAIADSLRTLPDRALLRQRAAEFALHSIIPKLEQVLALPVMNDQDIRHAK